MNERDHTEKKSVGKPRSSPGHPATAKIPARPVAIPPKPSGPVIYKIEKGADVWPSTKRS